MEAGVGDTARSLRLVATVGGDETRLGRVRWIPLMNLVQGLGTGLDVKQKREQDNGGNGGGQGHGEHYGHASNCATVCRT